MTLKSMIMGKAIVRMTNIGSICVTADTLTLVARMGLEIIHSTEGPNAVKAQPGV